MLVTRKAKCGSGKEQVITELGMKVPWEGRWLGGETG